MSVETIAGKILRVDPGSITDETSPGTLEQWDSMAHLYLIAELEEQFKVKISIADAMEMNSIAKIKEILRRYGAAD